MNSSLVWFGFLPVIAFLILDSTAGKRLALWGALILGCAEASFSIVQVGGFDYVSVAAFLILAGSVAVSLRTQDDFFFKIQGAIVGMLQALIMILAWYVFHKALLLDMANKYIGMDKLVALNPALDKDSLSETFRLLSFQLPWWMILHSLITIYAAANWGKWAWAFVRVPGFLIMLVLASGFAQGAAMPPGSLNAPAKTGPAPAQAPAAAQPSAPAPAPIPSDSK